MEWQENEFDYVYEETTLEQGPDWANVLLDYYLPDKEKTDGDVTDIYFGLMTTSEPDLMWQSGVRDSVREDNTFYGMYSNWGNELLDFNFPDRKALALVRGKTGITFKFWRKPSRVINIRLLGAAS